MADQYGNTVDGEQWVPVDVEAARSEGYQTGYSKGRQSGYAEGWAEGLQADPSRCHPTRGYHATPHVGCILR